ncbi:(2Fe-2S)-binding protein [Comamonas antarctica]|jgi:predicted molibdopterin-dependent oxidoreductase YjgC|uniref:(2Fe-2S)-binding protein n=1 Tax=Comamonas antarctica TaxID=2743470 RepID=A0A6N1X8S2_9BURK|nr:(2Fe-2S)-binding protein [Comamonas antarctica]QKV55761.1 (2Fe-2S)-binding protein [Comamonas antarctica]
MHTKSAAPCTSLFVQSADADAQKVQIHFEGQPLNVPAGISVASALLMSGVRSFRSTPVSGASRAPYCMMGVCFECLVAIDGRPGRQSCLVAVKDGMVIQRQEGASELVIQRAED